MKNNLFSFTIDINNFVQYIIEYCDDNELRYIDIDISETLLEYMKDEEILYKGNSEFNGSSFYNYIDDILRCKQKNKNILKQIEYYENQIIELKKYLDK